MLSTATQCHYFTDLDFTFFLFVIFIFGSFIHTFLVFTHVLIVMILSNALGLVIFQTVESAFNLIKHQANEIDGKERPVSAREVHLIFRYRQIQLWQVQYSRSWNLPSVFFFLPQGAFEKVQDYNIKAVLSVWLLVSTDFSLRVV